MSTHYQGSERERLVLDSWIKLSRAHNTVSTIMRQNAEGQGMTISQFGVLETLLHLGPLPVKEIGKKLLMTPANLVTVVDNLVKQDLARRAASEQDRRSTIIHLTAKGEDRIQTAFNFHLQQLVKTFSSLDDEQLKTLSSQAKVLGLTATKNQK